MQLVVKVPIVLNIAHCYCWDGVIQVYPRLVLFLPHWVLFYNFSSKNVTFRQELLL